MTFFCDISTFLADFFWFAFVSLVLVEIWERCGDEFGSNFVSGIADMQKFTLNPMVFRWLFGGFLCSPLEVSTVEFFADNFLQTFIAMHGLRIWNGPITGGLSEEQEVWIYMPLNPNILTIGTETSNCFILSIGSQFLSPPAFLITSRLSAKFWELCKASAEDGLSAHCTAALYHCS